MEALHRLTPEALPALSLWRLSAKTTGPYTTNEEYKKVIWDMLNPEPMFLAY